MTNAKTQRGVLGGAACALAVALFTLQGTLALPLPAGAQPPWAGAQGRNPGHGQDHEIFHYLLDHRQEIRRNVKQLPNGVETLTESDNETVAQKIREHARAMHWRVEEGRPIHMRDPLFAEIFKHAEQIDMDVQATAHGVRVRETSGDPYVTALIQEHARVVDAFVANGHAEVRRNHAPPPRP